MQQDMLGTHIVGCGKSDHPMYPRGRRTQWLQDTEKSELIKLIKVIISDVLFYFCGIVPGSSKGFPKGKLGDLMMQMHDIKINGLEDLIHKIRDEF